MATSRNPSRKGLLAGVISYLILAALVGVVLGVLTPPSASWIIYVAVVALVIVGGILFNHFGGFDYWKKRRRL